MKNKEVNTQEQNQVMEGYNPGVYRSLSILFIVLTILNLVVIIYAFAKTGYGLWHAEDALSYIAKIDGNFEDINQNVLNIQLHADNQQLISDSVDGVLSSQNKIKENAESFRQINMANIDKSIPQEFDASLNKVNLYYDTISEHLSSVKAGLTKPNVLQTAETERLREDAKQSLDTLFEKSDEATYQFFCRVGQSFLFVLLFLILTMAAGLYAIARSKKRDYAFALKLQNSKQKTANIRQKAVEIAYTNVVTGLKNRYALDEKLDERIKAEDVTIVMYNFNNFKSLNENYGRDFADEFVSEVAKKIVTALGKQAEVFSTDIDELCVLFSKELPKSRTNSMAQKILEMLSQPVRIRSATVQLTAAGCICHCSVNSYTSASSLFIAIDHGMRRAKTMCTEQNRSVLIPLQ
ncbi:MAG: diguanylate cyclase [Oscillospiraceae bacterium]|nr:diguanylate cyclase [Oscillospiraceae bacterium]